MAKISPNKENWREQKLLGAVHPPLTEHENIVEYRSRYGDWPYFVVSPAQYIKSVPEIVINLLV